MTAAHELVKLLDDIARCHKHKPWGWVAKIHASSIRRNSGPARDCVLESALHRLSGFSELARAANLVSDNTANLLDLRIIEAEYLHATGKWPDHLEEWLGGEQ